MSLAIRYSDQTLIELTEIWRYIAADNEDAADRLADKLVQTFETLAYSPEMGRRRNDLRPGMRSFRVGRYLIFYRIHPDRIDILHVLHGARNLKEVLTSEGPETFDDE